MIKLLLLISFSISSSYCVDTLIDALIQGTFTKKVDLEPTNGEDAKEEMKNQKIIFHYTTLPINGLRFEVENDGLNAYAKALYSGEFSDFDYALSANSYTSSAKSYTMDVNYNLRREIAVGSRYTLMDDTSNLVSYTGIYSSLILDELNKGLNVGIYYDKTGLDKKGDQFSLKIKSNF
ncbi:MAG: hypothetical protein J0647_10035 [Campylobacteraceae bacterium]|nr:hypothetical protein [Campylobacteraceae bacterium]